MGGLIGWNMIKSITLSEDASFFLNLPWSIAWSHVVGLEWVIMYSNTCISMFIHLNFQQVMEKILPLQSTLEKFPYQTPNTQENPKNPGKKSCLKTKSRRFSKNFRRDFALRNVQSWTKMFLCCVSWVLQFYLILRFPSPTHIGRRLEYTQKNRSTNWNWK